MSNNKVKEGKRRLLITIDDELLKKIEDYCASNGNITKSQFFTNVSLAALSGSETLPQVLLDSFVRNAMDAEIRAKMREVIEAQRALGLA